MSALKTLAFWHDHSTLANYGQMLFCVREMYDPAFHLIPTDAKQKLGKGIDLKATTERRARRMSRAKRERRTSRARKARRARRTRRARSARRARRMRTRRDRRTRRARRTLKQRTLQPAT